MADLEIRIPNTDGEAGGDVEMVGTEAVEIIEVLETGPANGEEVVGEDAVAEEEGKTAPRITFVDYLKSPIIELLVGAGEEQTLLTAHQALLIQSPFFGEVISQFEPESTIRRITLASENLDAMGSFLQYLYTGEYFPRKIGDKLETDPSLPKIDNAGDQLLRHARIYTLAEKLGLPELKSLSHSKIHRVTSTAVGEIAYARYVYANTARSDTTIRKPVASFWGMKSHVLRHEADDDFRQICLDFPEFAFDVLSFVLDVKERKGEKEVADSVSKSGRKRPRV